METAAGKEVYTIGCADPHPIAGIDLVQEIGIVPDTPAERERRDKAWERQKTRDLKNGIHRGYRVFA